MTLRTTHSFLPGVISALLMLALIPPSHAGEAMAANPPAASQVHIGNFVFTPAEITVAPGAEVTWLNEDDIPHLVAASGGAFRSKALDTDQQYAFKFTTPGTYEYFCAIHPHMKGTVVVK
jgi:plastocyanin